MRGVVITGICFLVFFMGNLIQKGAFIALAVILVNCAILGVTMIHLNKPFFHLIELDSPETTVGQESPGRRSRKSDTHNDPQVKEWIKVFRHPLIIKDEEFVHDNVQISARRASLAANKIDTRKSGHIEMSENYGVSGNKDSFVGNY